MYKLIDNQGALNDKIFNSMEEVRLYLLSFHSSDIQLEKETLLTTLLEIGDWTLEIKKDMSKEQIIARLQTIIEGIEGDRFTIENINQLIEDIK